MKSIPCLQVFLFPNNPAQLTPHPEYEPVLGDGDVPVYRVTGVPGQGDVGHPVLTITVSILTLGHRHHRTVYQPLTWPSCTQQLRINIQFSHNPN